MDLFRDLVPWMIILMAIVIIGGVVVMALRRSIYADKHNSDQGFTLQDLRDLHQSGDLSDAEFEKAKAAMIGRLQPQKEEENADMEAKKPGNGRNSTQSE